MSVFCSCEDNYPTLSKYLIKKKNDFPADICDPALHHSDSIVQRDRWASSTSSLRAAVTRRPRARHFGQTTISDIVPESGRSLFGPVTLPRVLAAAVDCCCRRRGKSGSNQLRLAERRQGSRRDSMTFSLSLSLMCHFLFFFPAVKVTRLLGEVTFHTLTHSSTFLPISSVSPFVLSVLILSSRSDLI